MCKLPLTRQSPRNPSLLTTISLTWKDQKKKQDLLIDSVNGESKRFEEQKDIFTEKSPLKRKKLKKPGRFREAQEEIEKVVASKEGLFEYWLKYIVLMQKQD